VFCDQNALMFTDPNKSRPTIRRFLLGSSSMTV
jgi:hypothetical protein